MNTFNQLRSRVLLEMKEENAKALQRLTWSGIALLLLDFIGSKALRLKMCCNAESF
jgi:hypothetical protein